MPDSTSISTLILLLAASALLLATMLYPSSLRRWLQRKRYQYEVTFALYMLTPTEKFIFNSVLFLLLSLFIIAASLYLPEHVLIITKRILYYFSGDGDYAQTSNPTASTFAEKNNYNVAQQVLAESLNAAAAAATQVISGSEGGKLQEGKGALAGQGRGVMDA